MTELNNKLHAYFKKLNPHIDWTIKNELKTIGPAELNSQNRLLDLSNVKLPLAQYALNSISIRKINPTKNTIKSGM